MNDRLYRHPSDRVIAGVAGGLATWLSIDPSLVRVVWVLLAIFSGGLFVLVYIVMMFVVPLPPAGWIPQPRGYAGSGPGPGQGWQPGAPWGEGPSSGWGAAAPGGAPGSAGQPSPQGPDQGWPAQPSPPGPADGWPAQPTPQGPAGGWPAQPTQPAWTAPRPGNAGLVAGVILVALGVWFLIDQYVRIDWDFIWPVVIMVAGGALIAGALMRSRSG